jgi:hypothetical protein
LAALLFCGLLLAPWDSDATLAQGAPSAPQSNRQSASLAQQTAADHIVWGLQLLQPTPGAATPTSGPITVNGRLYDTYIPAASKKGQWFHYTCEFDAAWVVLKTYGLDVGLEDQIKIVGVDNSVTPRVVQTRNGTFIYGGDITRHYSGDYKKNFLARSTGQAMRKIFEHYGLKVTPVNSREGIEAALRRGELIWAKVPVDFKGWRPATWVMPDGRTHKTVLGNDHAVVIMGFNKIGVVIRDVLGPTSTNWRRKYEYEVPWDKFLSHWAAQSNDGLAVAPPIR